MFQKSFLKGNHFPTLLNAFNGQDVTSLRLRRKHQAGINGFAVHQNSAGATLTRFTAAFYAEIALAAQYIQQQVAGRDHPLFHFAVQYRVTSCKLFISMSPAPGVFTFCSGEFTSPNGGVNPPLRLAPSLGCALTQSSPRQHPAHLATVLCGSPAVADGADLFHHCFTTCVSRSSSGVFPNNSSSSSGLAAESVPQLPE